MEGNVTKTKHSKIFLEMTHMDQWPNPISYSVAFTDNYVAVTETINSNIHANQTHSLWDYHADNVFHLARLLMQQRHQNKIGKK